MIDVKRILVVAMAALLLCGAAYATDYAVTKKAGDERQLDKWTITAQIQILAE